MTAATLDTQLCFALYSASNRLTSIYRPILSEYDLTYPQFIVMMALWEQDHVTISDIASRTGLSKPTMTPLLKLLEKKGFVTRQRLINNERQKSIVLTKTGSELAKKSGEITEQAFCATGLTRNQAKELIKMCQKIRTGNH